MSQAALEEEIWRGGAPVELVLAESDRISSLTVEPVYAFLPRMNYAPLALAKEIQHFSRCTSVKEEAREPWLSWGDQPLPWHLPVSVLLDLFKPSLPWKLKLHFSTFPSSAVMSGLERPAEMQKYFFHSLKQACFLRTGDMSLYQGLSKEDLLSAYDALKGLGPRSGIVSVQTRVLDHQDARGIPVRLVRLVQGKVLIRQMVITQGLEALIESGSGVVTQGLAAADVGRSKLTYEYFRLPDGFLYFVM